MRSGSRIVGLFLLIAAIACAVVFVYEDKRYAATEYGFEEITAGSNPINLNTATAEDLETLNGIGPATAERIIKFRTEVRPFETIYDIKLVNGIGEKMFDAIKSDICVE